MNKIKIFGLLIFLTSCASSLKMREISDSGELNIKYVIDYPSYAGETKTEAKENRRKYLNQAIEAIYLSIHRLGLYGEPDFNPDDFKWSTYGIIHDGKYPFTTIQSQPLVLKYTGNYNYGKLRVANKVWSYPFAEMPNGDYLLPPKMIRHKVADNLIVLKKKDIKTMQDGFYKNHESFKPKERFTKFLERSLFHRLIERDPSSNQSLYSMFRKEKTFQYGMGISDDVTPTETTKHFSLKSLEHRQFLWGVTFLLNSKIKAERINKQRIEITVSVPVKFIFDNYEIKPMSEFIEQ